MKHSDFPKEKRLLQSSDYKKVFSAVNGKSQGRKHGKLSSLSLRCLFCENDLGHSRLGLAITKKNIKLAVGRNKVKRLIREQFRQSSSSASFDIVFLANKGADTKPADALTDELNQLWHRLQKYSRH